MSTEDTRGERIAVLETRAASTEDRLNRIEEKIDRILRAANMAEGGWMTLMKGAGVVVTLAAAAGYIIDHVRGWLTGQ